MRCDEIQIHLIDALKEARNPALPPAFAEHLESCADCRELREVWQALGEGPVPQADPALSLRFRERLKFEGTPTKSPIRRLTGWGLPMAAAVLLMFGAFAAGFTLRIEAEPANPRQAALAQMRRGKAADRMQAIALVTPSRSGDSELAAALLDRVMGDPSTEVRLAAVEALYLFGSDPGLGARLAEALPRQEQPQVQLALVDLLVALRERRAAEALHRLLKEDRLGPEVRHRAETRLAEQRM
jgi:hypothetical protein